MPTEVNMVFLKSVNCSKTKIRKVSLDAPAIPQICPWANGKWALVSRLEALSSFLIPMEAKKEAWRSSSTAEELQLLQPRVVVRALMVKRSFLALLSCQFPFRSAWVLQQPQQGSSYEDGRTAGLHIFMSRGISPLACFASNCPTFRKPAKLECFEQWL